MTTNKLTNAIVDLRVAMVNVDKSPRGLPDAIAAVDNILIDDHPQLYDRVLSAARLKGSRQPKIGGAQIRKALRKATK
jgi:hypothetical protein